MLAHYLSAHYMTTAALAAEAGLSTEALTALVAAQCLPDASYVVTPGSLWSQVFGTLPAPEAPVGAYFPRALVADARQAHALATQLGKAQAAVALRDARRAGFATLLQTAHRELWPLPDAFAPDGTPIESGLRTRCETLLAHWQHGTFGLCVVAPTDLATIVRKEVLQEKLAALTEGGRKANYTAAQATEVRATIAAYVAVAMPFSPVEYPRSSRKRLVDDVLTLLG